MTDDAAAAVLLALAPVLPCAYCGAPMDPCDPLRRPTRDHIWPRRLRSLNAGRIGRVWCCGSCNLRKADKSPAEWLAEIMQTKGA